MVKSRSILYSTLIAAFGISLVLSYTPAGFPYSGLLADPRVQRHYITHTRRTFYDADGAVKFSDIGFFIKQNERNTKRTLDSFLEPDNLLRNSEDVMCKTEAFCGFPSYNISNFYWMKASDPPVVSKTSLKLDSKTRNGSSVEMSFDVVGTFLTLLFVAPEPGVKLTDTSVGFNQHEWTDGRVASFLKIVYGKASSDPFSFSLKLESSDETSDVLKVTVVTIDSHFEKAPMAQEFQLLVDIFPSYTFVQTHQAEVVSYTFK